MPSPFLGMDTYLEGEEWSDVHQAMAAQIRKQLSPHLTIDYRQSPPPPAFDPGTQARMHGLLQDNQS